MGDQQKNKKGSEQGTVILDDHHTKETGISKNAEWIGVKENVGEVCPEFRKVFTAKKKVVQANLSITAIGVYEARLNGKLVTDAVMMPGYTAFQKRLQVQSCDVTELIEVVSGSESESESERVSEGAGENMLSVMVGKGWHRGRISEKSPEIHSMPCAVILTLCLVYEDGAQELIWSDETFQVYTTKVLFSDLYDGEIYDASLKESQKLTITKLALSKERLISQEGELIKEHEILFPKEIITTPKGETVIDFGQNFAGYPMITLNAHAGEKVKLSFAEILDREENVYTENYRTAKTQFDYTCSEGWQSYKPHFTIYGFRYLRVDDFPGEVTLDAFRGIVVYSDIKRRSYMESGHIKLNKLYENVLWSQRSNFIDVPTDCPQRDERMGWTGDAQVFAKTAGYNYDVYRFFRKWLSDVRADQMENGAIPDVVPNYWKMKTSSTAWGDVICIAPWQMYLLYGDPVILKENFAAMKKWVDYITKDTLDAYLWTCTEADKGLWVKHYGDWLALDAPYGSYKGSTNDDKIASAFYYYSCSIVVKVGKILGENVSEYEALAGKIAETFKVRFSERRTQTDCVLPLFFGLIDEKEKKECAAQLAEMIRKNDGCLQTGFVGTPYLLYVLSENGYQELAYDLLLNEKNPSWFYEVNHGATTIWEHWDGVNDEGKIWSKDMNSYNHYAYGSVMDWVYSVAAGVRVDEAHPGFQCVIIEPHPDKRLGFIDVHVDTAYGTVRSKWSYLGDIIRYEIEVPVRAQIIINGKEYEVDPGRYIF